MRAQVDSLKTEVQAGQRAAGILTQVGHLVDSVKTSRSVLHDAVVKGVDYENFSNLVSMLSGYIHESEDKLRELETSLKQSKAAANSFSAMAANLKKEVEAASSQLAAIKAEAERYHQENLALTKTVTQKDSVLEQRAGVIKMQEQNLAAMEAKVNEVNKASVNTQADLYFEQGKALELAASRTHFAPRKKKETMREALEFYKRSLSLGKTDAKNKVEELEKELG